MIKIGITGQQGFLGLHLFNYLNLDDSLDLIPFERNFFDDRNQLQEFVSQCEVIVHLAAMNRHEDPQVIYDTNISLVEKLVNACESVNAIPHIIFSSSTQEEKDNLYGKSKKVGGKKLEAWANDNNGKSTNLVIPNVFGPFGKPFYNSVVATFCHQVVSGVTPTIHNDGIVSLIYINELLEEFKSAIVEEKTGKIKVPHRHEIFVSKLLEKLQHFRTKYMEENGFPLIDNAFDLALFNTFRCYIPHDFYPRPFTKHTDDRGSFVEIVRANTSGQFSFSTTKPGITRGNHFHTRKAERFAVIKGKACIQLRKVDSDEVIEYIIDGEKPAFVDMPIWYTHNISNVGEEELITLFWINEPYNQEDPDTYFVDVVKKAETSNV